MPLYMDHHKNLEGLTAEAIMREASALPAQLGQLPLPRSLALGLLADPPYPVAVGSPGSAGTLLGRCA